MEANRFNNFMKLNRELLDCYGGNTNSNDYKFMTIAEQKEFCRSERMKVEELLIKGKVSPRDFFAAVQTSQQ